MTLDKDELKKGEEEEISSRLGVDSPALIQKPRSLRNK